MSHDLTGEWSGIFNYPHSQPPTSFAANITDRGGVIVGTVSEADMLSDPPGAILTASIDGRHDGTSVSFAKFYDQGDDDYDMVLYEGAISGDGCEISGRWTIPGDWSGTFLMMRPASDQAYVERVAAAEL